MAIGEPKFKAFDSVTKRDGDGAVGYVLPAVASVHAGEHWYKVQFGASQEHCRESDLRIHGGPKSLCELLASDAYGGPESFRRHATAIKLKMQLTDTLYSYGASRTHLLPYQFVPLLKFLVSPYRRILIADEVGLGKTIEAGYILQEELARGRLARVLIVCPASLRLKWQDELLHRFGHRFEILNASTIRRRLPIVEGRSTAASPLRAIVSLQSIRNESFIETVASSPSPLDLLIVDEAHHCRNSQTRQSRAVSALIEQADSAVFLSATPIQTSELNLFTLLHMLVPEEFPSEAAFRQRLRLNQPFVDAETLLRQKGAEKIAEARERLLTLTKEWDGETITANPLFESLVESMDGNAPDSAARRVELQELLSQLNLLSQVFTRTKRRDVNTNVAQRKAMIPDASLTEYEQEVYDGISNFIFGRYQERHGDGPAKFILTTYQRQLASSIPASVRKFRELMAQSPRDWDDEIETSEDDLENQDSEARYKPIEDPEFREIIRGIDVSALERCDTKYELLVQTLRGHHQAVDAGERPSKKMLVFSYFRRSLDYLEARLVRDGFSLVRIDGSVKSAPDNPDADERQRRITRFRDDPLIEIMLTSEVGSEGLDFQFCDAMVNWDLPWNPMVVEQRIGRLDRIGQRSPQILIVNLACEGTIESRILNRLYERIGIFEHSIGELEPILGGIVRELEDALFYPRLTEEEQLRILHSREIAIETRRRKQEALDQQSELLIGHDEHFRAKLDRIRRFGRFVGGQELRLFAESELSTLAPGLRFEPDGATDVYRLAYRPEVERAIENALPRGDEEGVRFIGRYRRGASRFAFDGEVADKNPDVEPLHAQHPLIQALSYRLEESLIDQPQVASLEVRSSAVPSGHWFYLWAIVRETGYLSARSLLCSVIDLRGESVAPVGEDAGDLLMADMLRTGAPWSEFEPPSEEDAGLCMDAAEQHIRARVDDLHHRRTARMDAIKAARRGNVEATFRVRIERQRQRMEEMTERARTDAGASRILPAYRARLEQLEAERSVQLALIDELKLGTVTYSLLGAGFVYVVNP